MDRAPGSTPGKKTFRVTGRWRVRWSRGNEKAGGDVHSAGLCFQTTPLGSRVGEGSHQTQLGPIEIIPVAIANCVAIR